MGQRLQELNFFSRSSGKFLNGVKICEHSSARDSGIRLTCVRSVPTVPKPGIFPLFIPVQ